MGDRKGILGKQRTQRLDVEDRQDGSIGFSEFLVAWMLLSLKDSALREQTKRLIQEVGEFLAYAVTPKTSHFCQLRVKSTSPAAVAAEGMQTSPLAVRTY